MKMSFSLENYYVFYGTSFLNRIFAPYTLLFSPLPSLYLSVNIQIKHSHSHLSQRCILCGKKAQWRQQTLRTDTQICKAIYFSRIFGCGFNSYRHFKSNSAVNNDTKEESQDGTAVERQQVSSQHRIYVKQQERSLLEEISFATHFPCGLRDVICSCLSMYTLSVRH